MGLSSLINRKEYVGDGSSTVFPFPYYFFSQSDLSVFLFDPTFASSSVIQAQTLNTNYTISGTPNSANVYPNGGNVIMTSSVPVGMSIIIARHPALTQSYVLGQNQPVSSQSLVQQLDYLTALTQSLNDTLSRTIQLPDGLIGSSFVTTLPNNTNFPTQTGSYILALNSSSTGFNWINPTTGGVAGSIQPTNLGGTGIGGPYQAGEVIYAASPTAFAATAVGTPGQVLTSNGASAPTWNPVSLTGSTSLTNQVSGILPLSNGGTNNSSLAQAGQVYYGSGTTQFGQTTGGTVGQFLTYQGSSGPTWTSANTGSTSLTSGVTGILPTANGGTNNSAVAAGQVYYGSGTTQFGQTTGGTVGQFLTYQGSSGPTWTNANTGSTNLTNQVVGILPVGFGGTGTGTSYIQYGLIFASSATQFASTGAGASGVPLIGQGNAAPIFGPFSLTGSGVLTGTLAIGNGGTGVSSVTASATFQAWAGWDANLNLFMNNSIPGYTTTASAGGTTALNASSTYQQYFTGASTQTVKLPDPSTIGIGQSFNIVNLSTGNLTVQTFGASAYAVMAQNQVAFATCIANSGASTTAWNIWRGVVGASPTLPTGFGGTGQNNSLNQWGVIYAPTTTSMGSTPQGSSGSVLTGQGGAAPSFRQNPVLGVAGSFAGSLGLAGGTAGTFTQQAATSGSTYTVTWPNAQGASTTYLQNDGSGNLTWSTAAVAGSNAPLSVTTKSANYNAINTDDMLLAASGCSLINLYTAAGNSGRQIRIKKTGSQPNDPVTIAGSNATIDGSSYLVTAQYDCVTLVCDGSNWQVLDQKNNSVINSCNPSLIGFGAVTSTYFQCYKIGGHYRLIGNFTTPAAMSASTMSMSLTFAQTSVLSATIAPFTRVGQMRQASTAQSILGYYTAFAQPGNGTVQFMRDIAGDSGPRFTMDVGGAAGTAANCDYTIDILVPIQAWM